MVMSGGGVGAPRHRTRAHCIGAAMFRQLAEPMSLHGPRANKHSMCNIFMLIIDV